MFKKLPLIALALIAVTLKARVEQDGDSISATSTLTIPFVEWGMKDPSAFIFRADKKVEVSLQAHGILGE